MPDDLQALLAAHFDGTLDAAGLADLGLRLSRDPAAARAFADFARLEAGIEARFGGSAAWSGRHQGTSRCRPQFHSPKRRWLPLSSLAAAAMLLIACGAWFIVDHQALAAAAVISDHFTVTAIEGTSTATQDGVPCAVVRGLTLTSGTRLRCTAAARVTLALDDGTTLALAAQAEVALTDGVITLTSGQLLAEVAPQTTPLRLATHHAEIAVIGTRFLLTTSDRVTSCELYHGRLAVTRIADGTRVTLEAQQRLEVTGQTSAPLMPLPLQDPDLLAWYPLDEVAGHDASGHGRSLTISGGAPVPGRFGQALGCAGRTRAVSAGDMAFPADLTISLWFRTQDPDATSVLFCATGLNEGPNTAAVQDVLFLGLEQGCLKGGTSIDRDWNAQAVLGQTAVTAAVWHHAAFTMHQGSDLALYLDGRLEQRAVIHGNRVFAGKIVLGCSDASWSQQWFHGDLDEVRVWRRTLPEEKILGLASDAR